MDEADREALRAEWVGRIPRWYSPWLHIGATTALGCGLSLAALLSIRDLQPTQLLIVPLVFVLSNASEWRAHRDLLHKLQPWAKPIYVQHTLQHHKLYLTDDMEIRSARELRLVLIPSYGIVLIFLVTLPVTAALWLGGRHNLAALFVITTQLYVVSYEWLHLSYHLPRESFWGRRWLVRRLGRHHAIHHSPERMSRWNLNVTLPLWDWVRGTLWRDRVAGEPAETPS
ncbi:MAG TPA: sterol desaturase family protein [Myxococcales bacterium]|nr:sterol desaturase family protein [Myxococcales bacterium]